MKILIIRFSSLGDILLTTPSLKLIRDQYPHAEITYVTKQKFSEALIFNSNIDHLQLLNKQSLFSFVKEIQPNRKDKIDIVIDFHNSLRSRILTLLLSTNKVVRFKKKYIARWLLVFLKINVLRNMPSIALQYMQVLKKLSITPKQLPVQIYHSKPDIIFPYKKLYITIAPGATWYTKTWPIEYFINLTNKILNSTQVNIVFLGGKNEISIKKIIEKNYQNNDRVYDFIDTLNINETAYMISQSKILITNDSGLMHIASVFSTKIVALFLSTVPEFGFGPFCSPNNFTIISHSLKCKPCNHKGLNKCKTKKFECAHKITVDEVYSKVENYYKYLKENQVNNL